MKIKANNLEINYRLEGPDDGPVAMFSNSLMSNYSMWDGQMAALTGKYRVLRYDQRGHGGTETTPGPYTIELLAEDARALLDELDIEAIHFVGLSMGGFTAQMLATLYPERVESLCLCDTACIMGPKSLWDERIDNARSGGLEALASGTLERWFTPPFHTTGADQLEAVREMILGTGVEGYIGCAEAIRDMDICGNLAKISAPTLVLVGEGDPACTVEAAGVLHNGISQSELVIIPQAAHLPNIEQRDRFNEILVNFLNQQK
ncbi:MAG: 3-oxoadipate enol-lactonase [Desulfofustis sp.]|nr:3-oxoadipate enol-lactonase [Desulfofustis sp.]